MTERSISNRDNWIISSLSRKDNIITDMPTLSINSWLHHQDVGIRSALCTEDYTKPFEWGREYSTEYWERFKSTLEQYGALTPGTLFISHLFILLRSLGFKRQLLEEIMVKPHSVIISHSIRGVDIIFIPEVDLEKYIEDSKLKELLSKDSELKNTLTSMIREIECYLNERYLEYKISIELWQDSEVNWNEIFINVKVNYKSHDEKMKIWKELCKLTDKINIDGKILIDVSKL